MIPKFSPGSFIWATFLVLAFGQPDARSADKYEISDLGLYNSPYTTSYAINKGGLVVGAGAVSSGDLHATLWQRGLATDLVGPNGTSSAGYAINNAGQIVGFAFTQSGDCRACLWSRGNQLTIAGNGSVALGINASSDVVGWTANPDLSQVAFMWRHGQIRQLLNEPSAAYSVNDRAQIVGFKVSNGAAHAFLWQDPTTPGTRNGAPVVTDLGVLDGGTDSQALAINNRGTVVGWSTDGAKHVTAFVYDNAGMRALPTLGGTYSRALAINDHGSIVGTADTPDSQSRAVLWKDGAVMDLNSVLPADSGWTLLGAAAINDAGVITGWGSRNGMFHAFVLVPGGSARH